MQLASSPELILNQSHLADSKQSISILLSAIPPVGGRLSASSEN
jgi:hypothetical protein